MVSIKGIRISPNKIKDIREWPILYNVKIV